MLGESSEDIDYQGIFIRRDGTFSSMSNKSFNFRRDLIEVDEHFIEIIMFVNEEVYHYDNVIMI